MSGGWAGGVGTRALPGTPGGPDRSSGRASRTTPARTAAPRHSAKAAARGRVTVLMPMPPCAASEPGGQVDPPALLLEPRRRAEIRVAHPTLDDERHRLDDRQPHAPAHVLERLGGRALLLLVAGLALAREDQPGSRGHLDLERGSVLDVALGVVVA